MVIIIKISYSFFMFDVDEIKKIFGEVVYELRTQKDMTQEELAEYLSLSPHTITRIENGKVFVSCEVISKLCNLFKIEPSVLFTPRPHILYEEHQNYISKIKSLLPKFNSKKLEEIYNILLIMHNK